MVPLTRGWAYPPLTGQSRTDSARCGAALTCHPAPSLRGKGSPRGGRPLWSPRIGFRRAAAGVRGSGGMGSPYTRWSKTAGGAVPGWQDARGGWFVVSRSTAGRYGGPHPRPLSTMWRGVDSCFRGIARTWECGKTQRGCGRCLGGLVSRSGCGDWQGRGASPPGATGAGRPAQVRWRWVRHSDGADPAPRPWWPGVRQHPVPAIPHSDGHAPPHAGRRGVGHDPVRVRRHSDSTDPAPRP